MRHQRSVFYVAGIFIISVFTIIGGIISIFCLTKWTNHNIRTAIEGDFPSNTSHHGHNNSFDAEDEKEIDQTVRIMTIIVKVDMATTALTILITLMLFSVMSKNIELNIERRNSILAYIIWNSISILYNSITVTYIFLDLKTYKEVFFDVTLGMFVNISLEFCFAVFTVLYYRYLLNTLAMYELTSVRMPLNRIISIEDDMDNEDAEFSGDIIAGDAMLIEMVPDLNIY